MTKDRGGGARQPGETPEEYAERFERGWTYSQDAAADLPETGDGLDAKRAEEAGR